VQPALRNKSKAYIMNPSVRKGTNVQYLNKNKIWVPATVLGVTKDAYKLDIEPCAEPSRVRALSIGQAENRVSAGTQVLYRGERESQWVSAEVKGVFEEDGTYCLDVRGMSSHVDPDQIRLSRGSSVEYLNDEDEWEPAGVVTGLHDSMNKAYKLSTKTFADPRRVRLSSGKPTLLEGGRSRQPQKGGKPEPAEDPPCCVIQ